MQPRTIIALAAATIAVSAIASWLLLRGDGAAPPAPPPPPPPPKAGGGEVDGPDAIAADARVFRSRDEAILLARRAEDGRPLARAAVALLDAAGAVLERGETDSRGLWRGPCPAEARSAAIAAEAGAPLALPLPDPPPAPALGPPIFADRAELRPGDALRVLVWLRAGRDSPPAGVLTVDGEPVRLPGTDLIPGAGWRLFQGRVPGDARPGDATVEIGDARLVIPVVPRWGAAAEPAPSANPDVAAVGDAALAPADGGWRVALAPPADGHAVLVFASAGSRFLDHGVSIAEGGEAFVALPPEDAAAAIEVVAVVAAPDGFRVHRAAVGEDTTAIAFEPVEKPPVPLGRALRVVAGEHPVPLAVSATGAVPGGFEPILLHADSATSLLLPLDAFRDRDAIVRAVAIPPGRAPVEAAARILAPDAFVEPEVPAWVYEGDTPVDPVPRWLEHNFQIDVQVFVPAGVPTEFPSDPPIPEDFELSWGVVAKSGSGVVRLTAGPVVVGEESYEVMTDHPYFAMGGGGSVPSRHLADGAFVATSDAAGFEGVVLSAAIPVPPATARAADAPGLAISSRLPSGAAVGTEFDAVVTLRAAAAWSGPVEVELPLPRGLLPAEDGWSIRARAPEGTRVDMRDGRIDWRLSGIPAGETALPVRLRAAYRGRWAAPPAQVRTSDPKIPPAHGAGSVLVVE